GWAVLRVLLCVYLGGRLLGVAGMTGGAAGHAGGRQCSLRRGRTMRLNFPAISSRRVFGQPYRAAWCMRYRLMYMMRASQPSTKKLPPLRLPISMPTDE